jgi:hypothetical protein
MQEKLIQEIARVLDSTGPIRIEDLTTLASVPGAVPLADMARIGIQFPDGTNLESAPNYVKAFLAACRAAAAKEISQHHGGAKTPADPEEYIAKKYASITPLESDAKSPLLDAIDERTATPDQIRMALTRAQTTGILQTELTDIKATIADALGDLLETYRYEGVEEAKKLEAYLDSLLDATRPFEVPTGRVSDIYPRRDLSGRPRELLPTAREVASPVTRFHIRESEGRRPNSGRKLTRRSGRSR